MNPAEKIPTVRRHGDRLGRHLRAIVDTAIEISEREPFRAAQLLESAADLILLDTAVSSEERCDE